MIALYDESRAGRGKEAYGPETRGNYRLSTSGASSGKRPFLADKQNATDTVARLTILPLIRVNSEDDC